MRDGRRLVVNLGVLLDGPADARDRLTGAGVGPEARALAVTVKDSSLVAE